MRLSLLQLGCNNALDTLSCPLLNDCAWVRAHQLPRAEQCVISAGRTSPKEGTALHSIWCWLPLFSWGACWWPAGTMSLSVASALLLKFVSTCTACTAVRAPWGAGEAPAAAMGGQAPAAAQPALCCVACLEPAQGACMGCIGISCHKAHTSSCLRSLMDPLHLQGRL